MAENAAAEGMTMAKHGEFCWTEIATNDLEAGKNFYVNVFGWEFEESSAGGGEMKYLEYKVVGEPMMGGFYQLNAEFHKDAPPHFMNYILADNVDEIASKAFDLGGTVVQPPFDIPNVGRMCMLKDPTGAIFSVINCEVQPQTNAEKPRHGTVCWRELTTQSTDKAKPFYQELFGWKLKQTPTTEIVYDEIFVGEKPQGGMMKINEDWGEGWDKIPAHWMTYVAVDDCRAMAEKIKENGGNVCVPPFDAPNVGTIAVVNDPGGATFSIIELK